MPQTKCNTFFSQIRSVPNFLRDICTSPPPPTTPTISPCCQNPFSLLKATGWFLADKCATFKIQLYHILFVCLSLCYVLHTFSQQSDNIVIARKNGWTSLFLSQSHWHPFILHWNNSILYLFWLGIGTSKRRTRFYFYFSFPMCSWCLRPCSVPAFAEKLDKNPPFSLKIKQGFISKKLAKQSTCKRILI